MSSCSLEMKDGKVEETCDGKTTLYDVGFSSFLYPESYEHSSAGFLFAEDNLISPYNKPLNINKERLDEIKKENKAKGIWIGDEHSVEDPDLSKPLYMGVNMIHNIVLEEAKTIENPFTNIKYVEDIKKPISNSPNKIIGIVVQKQSAIALAEYDPNSITSKDKSACTTTVVENADSNYKFGVIPAEKGSPLFIISYSLANKDYKPCNYIVLGISAFNEFSKNENIKNKLKTDKLVGPLQYIECEGKYPKTLQSQLDTEIEIEISKVKKYLESEEGLSDENKKLRNDNLETFEEYHNKVRDLIKQKNGASIEFSSLKDGKITLTIKGDKIIEKPGIPIYGQIPMKSYVAQIIPTYSSTKPEDKNLYIRPEDILMDSPQIYNTDLNKYTVSKEKIKMLGTEGAIIDADIIQAMPNETQLLKSLDIVGDTKVIMLDAGVIKNPSWYKPSKTKIINDLFGIKESFSVSARNRVLYILCSIIAVILLFMFIYAITKRKRNNRTNNSLEKTELSLSDIKFDDRNLQYF